MGAHDDKERSTQERESKNDPGFVAAWVCCAHLHQPLVQEDKENKRKNPKKIWKDRRSPEKKELLIFLWPPIFPPSPKTVTSTNNAVLQVMNPGPSGVVPSSLVDGAPVSSNHPRLDLLPPLLSRPLSIFSIISAPFLFWRPKMCLLPFVIPRLISSFTLPVFVGVFLSAFWKAGLGSPSVSFSHFHVLGVHFPKTSILRFARIPTSKSSAPLVTAIPVSDSLRGAGVILKGAIVLATWSGRLPRQDSQNGKNKKYQVCVSLRLA